MTKLTLRELWAVLRQTVRILIRRLWSMPMSADLPPVNPMIALVEQAERNEQVFLEMSARFTKLSAQIAQQRNPAAEILQSWQASYQGIVANVRKQTDALKRGSAVFQEMYESQKRTAALSEQITGDYLKLYSDFANRLKEVQGVPSDDAMRAAVHAFQLMERERDELKRQLEAFETPEEQSRLNLVQAALDAEVRAKHRVFWYSAGLVLAPAAIVVVFWLSRL